MTTASSSSYFATLTGTTVDTVTFPQGIGNQYTVSNMAGATTLYISVGNVAPADPTVEGAGTIAVPSGQTIYIGQPSKQSDNSSVTFKILGNGNDYALYQGALDVALPGEGGGGGPVDTANITAPFDFTELAVGGGTETVDGGTPPTGFDANPSIVYGALEAAPTFTALLQASGAGAFAGGSLRAEFGDATILALRHGSFAQGYASDNGVIRADYEGDFAQGWAYGGEIRAVGGGSVAQGSSGAGATDASVIEATDYGSFAQGYAGYDGTISASGAGAIAQGYAIGAAAVDQVNTLTVTGGPTGGTWSFLFDRYDTGKLVTVSGLAIDISAADLQAAIIASTTTPTPEVVVAGPNGGPWVVTWTGASGGMFHYTSTANTFTGGTTPEVTLTLDTSGSSSGQILATNRGAVALGESTVSGFSKILARGAGSLAVGGNGVTVAAGGFGPSYSGAIAFGHGYGGRSIASQCGAFAQGYLYGGDILSTGWGSFAQGYAAYPGQVHASGSGSFAQGYAYDVILSSGRGSFAQGSAAGGAITASGVGSHAQGMTLNTGTITASGYAGTVGGSFAQGMANDGDITASSGGSFAQGSVWHVDSSILASSYGSFAQGYAGDGGSLVASENGAFAHGYAYTNDITSSGLGSIASGYSGPGPITASGWGSFAHGAGTLTASGSGSVAHGFTQSGGLVQASGDGTTAHGHATGAAADKVDVVTITGTPTGGTFTLAVTHQRSTIQTTGNIAYNASAATVQTALEALSNVAPGDVVVTGANGGPWTLTWGGTLVATAIVVQADGALLTGGTAPAANAAGSVEGVPRGSIMATYRAGHAWGFGDNGIIEATGGGCAAHGYAWHSAIRSTGYGSVASGYATFGEITATTSGSFAHGYTGKPITSSGLGSFAFGYSDSDAIVASATNAAQWGPGTNAQADSLQVGNAGIRLLGTTTAPTTPQTGDLRVTANGNVEVKAPNTVFTGGGLVLPNTSGTGIKVGTDASNAYGWKDLIGDVFPKGGGANTPDHAEFRTNVYTWFFNTNDESDLVFHLPHDYAPGTDLFIHAHWSHNGTAISGSLLLDLWVTYAKGFDQAAFGATVNPQISVSTPNIATIPQYRHMVSEIQLSAASPSASQLDTDNLEVDGLILARVRATTIPTITGSASLNQPTIFTIDIHYQSTQTATKNKAPNFYT